MSHDVHGQAQAGARSSWEREGKLCFLAKMGKIGQKIENSPRPEVGKKWPKNGEKIEKWPQIPFFRHFWAIFSPFRAEGLFFFFGQFFPTFGFPPVFHSMPGAQGHATQPCFINSLHGMHPKDSQKWYGFKGVSSYSLRPPRPGRGVNCGSFNRTERF